MRPKSLPLVADAEPKVHDPGTPVTLLSFVLDGDLATLEMGALRGQSEPERGISFSPDPTAARDGRTVRVVWVGVRAGVDGRDGFFSVVAGALRVDAGRGEGFRPEAHFTGMVEAIHGAIHLEGLPPSDLKRLGEALIAHDAGMWERRSNALRNIWPSP